MSNTYRSSNKKIAKNTLFLYFRMMLILVVSIYTTRVVLKVLGVQDFGIYNVVGGVITMLNFLTSSMSTSTQRFLSFELGRENVTQISKIFGMSVNIQIIICIGVVLLAETMGIWFVDNYLEIPENRVDAAKWVFRFSVFTFIVNVLSVPYNAAILTYEKMNVFAYISILEVVLKLLVVFLLDDSGMDKLKLYAVLLFGVSFIIRMVYGYYVNNYIKSCRYTFFWDKTLFLKLINFAGWNLWGNFAVVTYNQGINILLNIFFGPVINAARAIAYQVNSALNSFVSNFQTALRPQIIMSFASNDSKYVENLIFSGSRFTYFLMLILCLPVLLNTNHILELWLTEVPLYTVIFCRLVLLNSIINSLSGPLMTGAQASGKIKLYQGVVGGMLLLILPLSYFFLINGYPPQVTLYIALFINIITLIIRVFIVSDLLSFSKVGFLREVIFPTFAVSVLLGGLIVFLDGYIKDNLWQIIYMNLILMGTSLLLIYGLGLKRAEKLFLKKKLFQVVKK